MRNDRVTALLLVAVGGAAGSAARAAVALALPGAPLVATFLVNMVGAFALAVLVGATAPPPDHERRRRGVRLLVGTGFCGGFTTYSAVALHTAELLQDPATGYVAAGYAIATLGLGAVATLSGLMAGGTLGSLGPRS